jgi:hypothetical protein
VRFAFADRLRPDGQWPRSRTSAPQLPPGAVRRSPCRGGRAAAGISHWRAEVTPAARPGASPTRLQGKRVLMVGDGLGGRPGCRPCLISPATAAEATQNAADAVFRMMPLPGQRDAAGGAAGGPANQNLAPLCSTISAYRLPSSAGWRR